MVASAWGGAQDADIVAVVIDAKRGVTDDDEMLLARLGERRSPRLLVLNKIDLAAKPTLLALAQSLNERIPFASTFMVSALTGDGVGDLRAWLAAHVPEGPWHYPEDQMSDAPLRSFAAEITREKLYLNLHQELPYQSQVETESWTEQADGSVRIEQTIYVEREGQRKIVLGKAGQTIKAIGAAARKEIAGLIGRPVHLFLFVKVRADWGEDPERYRAMGLEYPRE
jgi:GTP-binding protein Era